MNTDRHANASEILHLYACDLIDARSAKRRLARIGFKVDLRQPDNDSSFEVFDAVTGQCALVDC